MDQRICDGGGEHLHKDKISNIFELAFTYLTAKKKGGGGVGVCASPQHPYGSKIVDN